jgi:signal transduction histidine kinase
LRLALAICGVSLAVVAASFVALRETTGADLRDRIDQELIDQAGEFRAAAPGTAPPSRAAAARRAKRFVASQGYHASSRIFAVQVRGRPLVTNQPELLERESDREHADGRRPVDEAAEELGETGLLRASDGLATLSSEETGELRVLSEPIRGANGRLGTFRVADPLGPVEDAEAGLNRAFVLVGLLALLASVAVALAIATVLTRPLRLMARVAASVGHEDLSARIGPLRRRDEIGVLARAFDGMLDRLERAFARQREFVSDASHELRTPLAVLRGQMELLDRETDPGERRRTNEVVLRELDRMNRLVDEMLALAASESGTLVHLQPVRLDGFLDDLRRDLPLLGDRDYSVTGPAGRTLEADPQRLDQVLRNLVRNAVAVTRPGDAISVTLTPKADALEFAVSDAGPGIPPDELDRVFDRFHRSDGARDQSGTGLGLAIAQAIVQAHGGRIWAESGNGATIRFLLPWSPKR